MTLGIGLALGSAVAHATWNIAVKRVASGGTAALWAYSVAGLVIVLPLLAVVSVARGSLRLDVELVLLSIGSTVLHTTYAAGVQLAYRWGDVTQVYPVSRGVAPVLVAVAAWAVVGQQPSGWQWGGIIVMSTAVYFIADGRWHATDERSGTSDRRPLLAGAGIGALIAAYTTFDGWAVVSRGVDPLTYYAVGAVLQAALVTALLRGRVRLGLDQLSRHRGPVALLALLIPTSYVLALYATQVAPVSVVAAVRSTSLVWAAVAATALLHEHGGGRRWIGTGLALASIVLMIQA